ncbi:BCCT family transporter [Aestuariispira insulae]|uniref:BCCT family betaine/carnitine transporter n=1 Tax=Aestuariispira insulae TaxID=1461337 RepID=A0A3D9HEV6_9PROT|nr:BCCT family transporter [Aestuariispira insulae]RED48017.1 BCCT family betaine/carnitine transporter [Aestuariispira insulae]
MSDEKRPEYVVGQDNVEKFGFDVHNPVFFLSGLVTVLFVLFALIFKEDAAKMFGDLRPYLTNNFDWVFMIAGNIFVLVCLFLIVSPYGKIRLGGQDAKPDYSYAGWFAMLFAAGMGIGLMFYGVLEPVYHMQNPPLGVDPANTELAREVGMAATIFHWGLHPWAIYAVVALALAFFCYNRGLPLTIRAAFYPLVGKAAWGWFGHIVDILAVFATLFGLATSLGLGAEQAGAGLSYLFGIESTDYTKVALIIGITAVALISVVAGLEAGVKRLSEINMVLAAVLLIFIIAVGPTLDIVAGFFNNTVAYLEHLPALSNWIDREDESFMQGWTTFYWAWWISWSPFVGMFIARVSRGRTVREFITCVLIIPTLVSILWMTVFGGTAIDQIVNDGYQGVTETIAAWTPELSLFKMLDQLPMTQIASLVGIVLVIVFFVTSSDSGSLVIDTITAGGKVDAPTRQRVFWCVIEGLIAIALLLGGGLASLQAAAIATGFPFAIVLVLMCVSIIIGLAREKRRVWGASGKVAKEAAKEKA